MLQDPSTEPDPPTSPVVGEQRRRRETFGNRRDLAEVYERANRLIVDHGLLRLKRFEEIDGVKRLTICNLWRLERNADGSLHAFAFDLAAGEWRKETDGTFKSWVDIPFCPVRTSGPPTFWRKVIRKAIWRALDAAGYGQIPSNINPISEYEWEAYFDLWLGRGYHYSAARKRWTYVEGLAPPPGMPTPPRTGLGTPNGGAMEMRKEHMAAILLRRILGRERHHGGKTAWTGGILNADKMNLAAKGLRACLWEHFIDREVVSALMVQDYRVSFVSYVDWASRHREDLLRIARERRNLLPLLHWIHPDQYGRLDLFSRKLWVKGGRKSTLVDLPRFARGGANLRLRSFDSKSAWKALSAAPASVVRAWGYSGRNAHHWTNIAAAWANVHTRVPVVAIVALVRFDPESDGARGHLYGVSPVMQHLYRLFLQHAVHVWKTEGFVAVKAWLRGNGSDLRNLLDYLEDEGFEQGVVDRNATWASLRRRSHDWHERVRLDRMEATLRLEWRSALPETEINGVQFRPLTTSAELAREGYDLHHCIGSYAIYCSTGRYRAFGVSMPDGTRSTLGLTISGTKKKCQVKVEQHRGKYNDAPAPAAVAAGQQLAVMYQAAVRSGLGENIEHEAGSGTTPAIGVP